ncbi:MAG: LamG domain-containing protein [Actinomycetota bacterium]|nr:LamG domain-containing protein [Actinomycetota bacterium]
MRRAATGSAAVLGAMFALLFATPASAQASPCGSASPGYSQLVLASQSLRAYYRLDEAAGLSEGADAVACDLAGENEGAFTGALPLAVPGALVSDPDPGASFSGLGSVRVSSSSSLSPRYGLTLEAWVKPALASGTLVRKDGQYLLRLVDGSVVFRVWTEGGTVALASDPVVGTVGYQHLVAVFNSEAGMRIYRNARLIASGAAEGELRVTDSPLYLGSSSGEYDFYTGNLDEVAVYGAPTLLPGVVRDHYAAARPPAEMSSFSCGFGSFRAGTWPDGCWRPYSDTSPFNRQVPDAPQLMANSSQIVQRMLSFGRAQSLVAGEADTDDDYWHPTYYSQPSDPLFRLHCYKPWGTCRIEGHEIRIPDAARAAGGGDAHMTVVDQETGWEYDMYDVRSKPAGGGVLELGWGGRTRIDGDGLDSAATAAGYGNLAGIVRAAELAAGHIDHALFLVVKCTSGRVVYPAGGTGRTCDEIGQSTTDAPPMGARFQLAMTPEQIDGLSVPQWKKTILRAMATYGMYVGDTGGGSWGIQMESGSTFTSFGVQDPLVAFAQANGWTPYNGRWVGNLSDGVDWSRYLRVVDPCVTAWTC